MLDVFDSSSPKLKWWRKGDERQNFGDFLTPLLWDSLSCGGRADADVYCLVGSVIAEVSISELLKECGLGETGRLAFWGCGVRVEYPLSPDIYNHCLFFGVRGPLSRDVLRLPATTPLGDTGLLAPLLYAPSRSAETRGRVICMPHIAEPRSDEELLRKTGADMIVWPTVANSRQALLGVADKIASADFVLTGALHGAIMACAYDVPFAFLDVGYLDIPFKWRDFAASIGVGAHFVDNIAAARIVYEKLIRPKMVKPKLLPLLSIAPFQPRKKYLALAALHDGNGGGRRLAFDLAAASAAVERLMSDPAEAET